MTELREFRLGIIGGCLSHQPDIPHSRLYHRQLDRLLQEREGVRLKVAIVRHFNKNYEERLHALLSESSIDGVLLHLRVVFTAKSVLLVNRLVNDRRIYRLHPFLFRQKETGWNESLDAAPAGQILFASSELLQPVDADQDPYDRPVPSKKLFGFRLRTLNLAVGALAGLDDWAIADEMSMFEQFRQVSAKRDIPFFVLGPTPVTTYAAETKLWRKMNRKIEGSFTRINVPYTLLERVKDTQERGILLRDGFHLNEYGHAYVAQCLYPAMTPWIKGILRNKR